MSNPWLLLRSGFFALALGVPLLIATSCGGRCVGDCVCRGAACQCPGSGDCLIDCSGDCDLACTGSGDCDFVCGAGCLAECTGSGACLIDVGAGSTVRCPGSGGCEVTCRNDCRVECPGSGVCFVACAPGAVCDLERCSPTSCPDGVQVCNGAC